MPPTIRISQTVAGLGSTLVKVSVQATSEATVNVFPYEYGGLSLIFSEKNQTARSKIAQVYPVVACGAERN